MSTQRRAKRGTTAQILDPTNLIAEGEQWYATDTGIMYLGDSGGNKNPQIIGRDDELLQLQKAYDGVTTGTTISVTTAGDFAYEKGRWLWFTADANVLKPVGLSVNGGIALTCRDGLGADIDIEAGKTYFAKYAISGASFFQLASGDNEGGTVITGVQAWSDKYDGVNNAISDTNGDVVNVGVGDYVYSENGESKIILSGSEVLNPNYNIWDETGVAPIDNWAYPILLDGIIYSKNLVDNSMTEYDTLTETWDETNVAPSGTWINPILIGTDIYVKGSDNSVWVYNTLTKTWDETSVAPSGAWSENIYYDNVIYARGPSDAMWRYNISTKTWDETSVAPSNWWFSPTVYDNKIYVNGSNTGLLWIYDILLDTWDITSPSASATWNNPMLYEDKIYVNCANKICVYDILLNTWDETSVAPSGTWSNPLVLEFDIVTKSPTNSLWYYGAVEFISTEVSKIFPKVSDAITVADLLSNVSGVLRFSNATAGQPITGFKDTKALF